jgi:hypothetical protein
MSTQKGSPSSAGSASYLVVLFQWFHPAVLQAGCQAPKYCNTFYIIVYTILVYLLYTYSSYNVKGFLSS